MTLIVCHPSIIDTTLSLVREIGKKGCECVVLWLAQPHGDTIRVVEAYRPIQKVASHRFYIPPESMRALRERQRASRLMVAAQVQTHPEEAFHSEADDEWAIVRHEGALSLVIPEFAAHTTRARFELDTKFYRLSASDAWQEVRSAQLREYLRIE